MRSGKKFTLASSSKFLFSIRAELARSRRPIDPGMPTRDASVRRTACRLSRPPRLWRGHSTPWASLTSGAAVAQCERSVRLLRVCRAYPSSMARPLSPGRVRCPSPVDYSATTTPRDRDYPHAAGAPPFAQTARRCRRLRWPECRFRPIPKASAPADGNNGPNVTGHRANGHPPEPRHVRHHRRAKHPDEPHAAAGQHHDELRPACRYRRLHLAVRRRRPLVDVLIGRADPKLPARRAGQPRQRLYLTPRSRRGAVGRGNFIDG